MRKQIGFLMLTLLCLSCGDNQTARDEKLAQLENENKALRKEVARLSIEKDDQVPERSEPGTPLADLTPSTDLKEDNLNFLKRLNGKYPYEVKLLQNPALSKRLKILLKDRFDFLKDTWAVESPIEVSDSFFVSFACQAHNCGNTNFMIVYDFRRDILYAGIREDQMAKTYSEDGSDNQAITTWANE